MDFKIRQVSNAKTFSISALLLAGVVNAQSVQDGLKYLEGNQFDKAKEVFEGLAVKTPSADNYYYLGYYYLSLDNPNIDMAVSNFNKGLDADSKSNLNKIGLATIKLYQKDQSAAKAAFEAVAKDTRYKDANILYRIADAYTLFHNSPDMMNPDLAIDYAQRLLTLTKGKEKPEYYIALGNAYYEKLDAGNAMTNYSKALDIDNFKVREYALIGNLWAKNKQQNLAKENFDKAIAEDPSYATTYKYMANNYILNQQYVQAFEVYQKYCDLTGNINSDAQLKLTQLALLSKDYDKTLSLLNQYWDKITSSEKYKIKALALLEKGNLPESKQSIDEYFKTVPESKLEGVDYGTFGKIYGALAASETNTEVKKQLTEKALTSLRKGESMGDKNYDYPSLISALSVSDSAVGGKTSPEIQALQQKLVANPNDTKSWYELAVAQHNIKDYTRAIQSWDKLIELIPTWPTSYIGKAMSLYGIDNKDKDGRAAEAYQKFIELVEPKQQYSDSDKANLATAYVFFAYKNYQQGNDEKAKEYMEKALTIDPHNADALKLKDTYSKQQHK